MRILPNGAAVIEGDTHHAVWVEQQGIVHDGWFAGIIAEQIFKWRVSHFLDVGANIGTLTVPMLQIAALGRLRVTAIEANPKAVECLRHNTAFSDRITIIQAGAGAEPGSMFLHECANAGASSLAKTFSPVECPIIAIDSLNGDFGLIKMDIEGMEVSALLGAMKTIRRCRPVLILEVNQGAMEKYGDRPQQIYDFMARHNYRFSIIQPDCKFGDPQFDILCVPE